MSPGYIGTDMVKAIRQEVLDKIVAGIPVKRLGTPEDIASIIAWLASEEGGYSTGADFSVNGGLVAHPGLSQGPQVLDHQVPVLLGIRGRS